MSKLPIGIQSFEDIRKNNYLYVDKTKYIWDLIETGKVYFLSRPRRFGKSLFLSTLEAYFRGGKELFRGLDIEKLEGTREKPWVSYPVLHFSLSGGAYDTEQGLIDQLNNVLINAMKEYSIDSSAINGETLPVRFFNILCALHDATGRQVVVLLDEYDKPLLTNIVSCPDMEEKNRTIFKSFFSVLKDADAHLKFVFVTGITKFSKVSIFSDLNQLKDISLLPKYGAICGITEQEVRDNFQEDIDALAKSQGLSQKAALEELARMYDGYHFSRSEVGVYNPFSLLNALSDEYLGRYWFETGTPTFLYKKLVESKRSVQEFSDGVTATESRLGNYLFDDYDLVPLYYQAGYLTITGYDSKFKTYTLSYPNDEVKYGYLESLIPIANASYQAPDATFSADKMIGYLRDNNPEPFMQMLQALLASVPYYEGKAPVNEQQWRNILYAIFVVLGQYVRSEVHSSRGRSDCILENDRYVYIFEFKQDKTAEEAIEQIDANGYAVPYAASQKKVVKIGANFSTKMQTLDKWIIV